MANKPYDRRIINQLERPTSSDLNIAQGQIISGIFNLLGSIVFDSSWPLPTLPLASGFLNNSFKARLVNSAARTIALDPGIGISSTSFDPAVYDINGVTGLNQPYGFNAIFKGYDEDRITFTVPLAPTAGFCRRDLIAVRSILNTEGLADATSTDIYNTASSTFDTETKDKTYTADVGNVPVSYIAAGVTPTTPVVYITGDTFPYTEPDDLLAATVPSISGTAYNSVAIVNVVGGTTSVVTNDINDYRRIIAPADRLTLFGSATVGSSATTGLGGALADVRIRAPSGCLATIFKFGNNVFAGQRNVYDLCVFGARNIDEIIASFGIGDIEDVFASPYGAQVRIVSVERNLSVTEEMQQIFADSTKCLPSVNVAIGQNYHLIRFSVGTITVSDSVASATVNNTLGGTISIPNPPSYPNQWPTGTYTVDGNTVTKTYYLSWAEAPESPVTGIPTPRYELSRAVSGASHTLAYTDLPTTYQRVVGFVVNNSEANQPTPVPVSGASIWKLRMRGYVYGDTPVPPIRGIPALALARARLFLYDGSTNPELGTPIAEAETYLPAVDDTDVHPIFEFEMFVPYTAGTGRLYLEISLRKDSAAVNLFNVGVLFNNENTGMLETNFVAPAPYNVPTPTVTIPAAGSAYPGGSYSLSPSGSIGVTYRRADAETRFNSSAEYFNSASVRTVPVHFTLNMHLDTN